MITGESVVFDLEADGLEDATRIWCMHAVSLDGERVADINVDLVEDPVPDIFHFLDERITIICHNIIGYDGPLLERLMGREMKRVNWIDTLILSKMFFPDIKAPKGVKGQHGLAAWGARFGYPKPEHEDWSQYSPEMQVRVEADVEINLRLYNLLLKKGWMVPI